MDWVFCLTMAAMSFPLFVHWVRQCISSARYSVVLNGSLEGYFLGQRGLRQGDPISSYLFFLIKESFQQFLMTGCSGVVFVSSKMLCSEINTWPFLKIYSFYVDLMLPLFVTSTKFLKISTHSLGSKPICIRVKSFLLEALLVLKMHF